ncbi:MAG: TIM barrel protein [Bacteroidota bacterium]
MKTRREFLKASAFTLGSLSMVSNDIFAAKKKVEVGVQLFSVRLDMKNDPLGTLKKLAEMGYKNVEHANYINRKFYGYSAAEFRKVLDDLGLKMPSGHTVLDKTRHWDSAKNDFTDVWKYTVEDSAICGQKYVISPSLSSNSRKEVGELKRMMEIFNKSGELCQKSGMKFGYHNHDFEFAEKLDGVMIYDIIMQNTDAKYVSQQLDIGNMYGGGGRAIDVIKKYPGRFESMHVKDEVLSATPSTNGHEKWESSILGKGVIGTKEVIDLGRKIGGTTQFIIEQESYQGMAPIDAMREDLAIMKKWGY